MSYWRERLLPRRPQGAQTLPCAGGLGDLWDAIATEQVGFGREVPRVPWQGECLKGEGMAGGSRGP